MLVLCRCTPDGKVRDCHGILVWNIEMLTRYLCAGLPQVSPSSGVGELSFKLSSILGHWNNLYQDNK